MAKLIITIDTTCIPGKEVDLHLTGDENQYFKIPAILGAFIERDDRGKVYLVGAVTRAAEADPTIARNIVQDISQHQMNKLLGNKNTIESMRREINALKEK